MQLDFMFYIFLFFSHREKIKLPRVLSDPRKFQIFLVGKGEIMPVNNNNNYMTYACVIHVRFTKMNLFEIVK